MRISTKSSIALHLLVLIGVFPGRRMPSETLGRSTGCNPVVVRNILGSLKRAGILEVHRGTGGATLLRDPAAITVLDVFEAVDDTPLEALIGLHPDPNPACPVGRNIYTLLAKPYQAVAGSVREAMAACTLDELIADYHVLERP